MRKRLVLVLVVVSLLVMGCGNKKDDTGTVDAYVDNTASDMADAEEINNNSSLPARLLEKVELTEREKGTIGMDKPYYDSRSSEGIQIFGFPYPEYNSGEVYITQIVITSGKYNILGLTVGDKPEKIEDTMKKYNYSAVETDVDGMLKYEKGNVSITIKLRDEQAYCLYVGVSVYVPEGVMF